jgi:hypothetical protein
MVFDARRAMLKGPDLFTRFTVPPTTVKLSEVAMPDNESLIVFQRSNEKRALLVRQMAYHHAAQGELAGEPFLISF